MARGRAAAVVLLLVATMGGEGARAAAPGPGKERRLHLASAEASSYLVNDWNRFQENYLPLYVGDDDPRTAWNLKTEGIGEWLRMKVTPMERATRVRIKIRNGYQKTPRLFEANARARALTVVLLPEGKTFEVELADKNGWQELAVEQPAGRLEAIELRVKSVYAGKKYDDLCISDVQLYVTAGSSDNPAFEKQRFEKIAEWKKERAAAAKLFQTDLGKTLPIAPQYLAQETHEQVPPGEDGAWHKVCRGGGSRCYMEFAIKRAADVGAKGTHAAALRAAAELARAQFAGMTPVRVSVRDKRPIPRVDGLCTPPLNGCQEDPCANALPLPMTGQLGYLDAEALALVEQAGLPSFSEALDLKPPQCHHMAATTFAWAVREPAPVGGGVGRLRALLMVTCGLVEGREGPYPTSQPQLLVYGADGKLEVVAGTDKVAALDWRRDADGPKLARADISGMSSAYDLTVEGTVAVAGK